MAQEQNASFCSLFPQQAFGQCRQTGVLKERSRGDSRPRLSGRARLDLLYGQGKTSVARCLNRTAGGGCPHVVSCRDTPHQEQRSFAPPASRGGSPRGLACLRLSRCTAVSGGNRPRHHISRLHGDFILPSLAAVPGDIDGQFQTAPYP